MFSANSLYTGCQAQRFASGLRRSVSFAVGISCLGLLLLPVGMEHTEPENAIMDKALILHSGGLDSTVCLLKARERGRQVVSLGIDYGQRHRIELEFARHQCAELGVERKVLRVEWDKPLRDIPEDRSIEEIRQGISPAFLPGRNLLFLSLASAEAVGLSAGEVWVGVNALDFSGYPDCRPEFINAFAEAVRLAMPEGPSIVAPLLGMSKPDIAREAFRLGIKKGDTWSCYRPLFSGEGIIPCRRCDACILHDYAWSFAGGLDGRGVLR